jgi:hypothetical protein
MEVVGEHYHIYGGDILDKHGIVIDRELQERFGWKLLSCSVCKKVTLIENYSNEYEPNEETDLLYPECNVNYLGVPKEVKTAFESALKVKNIDASVCLLSLRRVLEAICKEQGAKGSSLEVMIKDVLEKGKLPSLMDDACWIIRQLGNDAAHAGDIKVHMSDVNQTIGFLKTIMQYLYTLPEQMKGLKKKIEKRKEKHSEMKEL